MFSTLNKGHQEEMPWTFMTWTFMAPFYPQSHNSNYGVSSLFKQQVKIRASEPKSTWPTSYGNSFPEKESLSYWNTL